MKSFLTCNSFVALNSEALQTILAFLEETDPDLLELLHFYHYEVRTENQNALSGTVSMKINKTLSNISWLNSKFMSHILEDQKE